MASLHLSKTAHLPFADTPPLGGMCGFIELTSPLILLWLAL
jgi:hypothetical protein